MADEAGAEGEWGYDGVVISDYAAVSDFVVHGVAANEKEAARMAFECECDMEMCSSTYIHHLKELIEEGVLTEKQLDKAVLKILDLKNKLGLFEDPYRGCSREKHDALCLSAESRGLVRRAAAECAVLLKNNGAAVYAGCCGILYPSGPAVDRLPEGQLAAWRAKGSPLRGYRTHAAVLELRKSVCFRARLVPLIHGLRRSPTAHQGIRFGVITYFRI